MTSQASAHCPRCEAAFSAADIPGAYRFSSCEEFIFHDHNSDAG